jgi:uncharacterized protein YdeI (YjbR/CyaY-like superfamily)
MKITHFKTQKDFRRWLEENHAKADELQVGFYKKATGLESITYQEALDEALCFGWIDGVRRRVDDKSYTIRFTPRRARSHWSAINIRRIGELTKLGRVHAHGLKVFESRDPARTGLYSNESKVRTFSAAHLKRFKANKKAWAFFQSSRPSHQRMAMFWVGSAKKEETRDRRLNSLIEMFAAGRNIEPMGVKKK